MGKKLSQHFCRFLIIIALSLGYYLLYLCRKERQVNDFTVPDSNIYGDYFSKYDLRINGNDRRSDLRSTHDSRCFYPNVWLNLTLYLTALENSVRIVSLPPALSSDVSIKCDSLGSKKKAILSHPHSVELHFPRILKLMRAKETNNKLGVRDGDGIRDGDRDDITNTTVRFKHLTKNHVPSTPLWKITDELVDSKTFSTEPLFYYLETLPYHVIYCTKKKNNKEDWSGRDPYWRSVADYILTRRSNSAEMKENHVYHPGYDFMQNMGADFLIPASHPQSGPSRIHPSSLSYLQRATFLKTDFDIAGSDPKDIIVPYYTVDNYYSDSLDANSQCNSARTLLPDHKCLHNRSVLLFFAGSDNPKNGYRTLFLGQLNLKLKSSSLPSSSLMDKNRDEDKEKAKGKDMNMYMDIINSESIPFKSKGSRSFYSYMPLIETKSRKKENAFLSKDIVDSDEIYFSLNSDSLSSNQYHKKLLSSKFCLVLKGDTTSSKRLFSAISGACIPVIISDGLKLPFSNIINYSSFTITFPESVIHDMNTLLQYLRQLPIEKYTEMYCALVEARRHLIYDNDYINERGLRVRSFVNPVTLTLIDALMRRETMCRSMDIHALSASTMCQRLLYRLNAATEVMKISYDMRTAT